MFTQAEIEYIQKQLARGLTADAITNKLVETGWDKDDIVDGLKEVERISALTASLSPSKAEEPIKAEVIKIAEDKNNDSPLSPIIGLETKPSPSVVSLEKESIFPNANGPIEPKAILKVFVGVILSLLILSAIGFAYYQFFYKPSLNKGIDLTSSATNTDTGLDMNDALNPASSSTNVESASSSVILPLGDTMIGDSSTSGIISAPEVNCGSDVNCFVQAADNCQKVNAYFTKNTIIPFVGADAKVTAHYQVTGQEGPNCVARIKVTEFVVKFSDKDKKTLIAEGRTLAEITEMEKSMSSQGVDTGQVCKLDLSKKLGTTLNYEVINSTSTKVSFSTASNSTDYQSGMKCIQYSKLHDNPNCKLSTGGMSEIGLQIGGNYQLSVSGYSGLENKINWRIGNTKVARASSSIGSRIDVIGVATGTTEAIATDTLIGSDCNVSIGVKVSAD